MINLNCMSENKNSGFLSVLQDIIDDRKKRMPDDSYTTRLFTGGVNKIAQKVGEEAVELIIEAKDNDDIRFKDEAADLLYHLLVLLSARGLRIEDIEEVLKSRHTTSK